MINLRITTSCICDNCKKTEETTKNKELSQGSRHLSSYYIDTASYHIPPLWYEIENGQLVCSIECLKQLHEKNYKKYLEKHLTKYNNKIMNNIKNNSNANENQSTQTNSQQSLSI